MDGDFGLLKELLDFTGLADGDPRLVLSIPQNGVLPVTINRRYVLAAFRGKKPLAGFIFGVDFEQVPELLSASVSSWRFRPFLGEIPEETPYFIRLRGEPSQVLSAEQKAAWKEAVLFEVEHGQTSPFWKYHEPVVYRAAVDAAFRAELLDEAFGP